MPVKDGKAARSGAGIESYASIVGRSFPVYIILEGLMADLSTPCDAKEGVIRFQVAHRESALDPKIHGKVAHHLIHWRHRLVRAGLVGYDPNRYGGVGFGNLSGRLPPFPGPPGARPFLITGTQTGWRPSLTLAEFCVVSRYNPDCNSVESFGPVQPSSESMTHGILYDADETIRFVFHGHSPAIWEQARMLGLPVTDPAVDYGTPAMCREVQNTLQDPMVARGPIVVMGGHQDGVLAFGRTAGEAGHALLYFLLRASYVIHARAAG